MEKQELKKKYISIINFYQDKINVLFKNIDIMISVTYKILIFVLIVLIEILYSIQNCFKFQDITI